MSFFAVAAQVSASPLPSPEVVVQTVAVTPEWLKQFVELLSFVVPGYLASFLHTVLKNKSTKLRQDEYDWLNAALLFAYSFGVSVAVLAAEHKLDFHNPEALGTAFLLVLGAAAVRYNAMKLKQVSPATSTSVGATVGGTSSLTSAPTVSDPSAQF
jgi:hypothetical protein